jgi:Arc/MetJ-type ribon-helix-helix transcriptional regulator
LAKSNLEGELDLSDFTYTSLSDFVRQALNLYQQKELQIKYHRITKRKQVGIKWNDQINDFYLTLPSKKRTEIINGLLNGLLEKRAKTI